MGRVKADFQSSHEAPRSSLRGASCEDWKSAFIYLQTILTHILISGIVGILHLICLRVGIVNLRTTYIKLWSDGCEQADELRMFRWGYRYAEHP
jgi:hypothetical protein